MSDVSLQAPSLQPQPVAAKPWRRWLALYFTYNGTINLLFTSAIWVIYLSAHGYSPFMIGLFEMIFHVAKFVAEVPSGIFADLLGRRKSLIVYCLLSALDTMFFLVPTVPSLLIGFALSGIAYAFLGGAHEAVLWTLTGHSAPETTAQHTARYSRVFSWTLLLTIVCGTIGTSLGGYLGNVMETLPFICRVIVCLLAIIPLLLLPRGVTEPEREQREYRNPLTHLLRGLRIVWRSPRLLGLICISGLLESCGTTVFFFSQLQLHSLGFALSSVGVIIAVSSVSQFAFTALAPTLIRRVPLQVLLALCVSAQLTGLLMMVVPNTVVSLVGFLLFFQAATSISYPTVSTCLNESCPEAQRATVLSFETGLFSLAMIVLFPLFGLGLTNAPFTVVYSWTALALVLGSAATYGLVRVRSMHLRRA